jgi:hypothetical protein
MAKKAVGRPKGSKHKDRPVADEQIAQCPHCGSCNRGQFGSVSRINGAGTFDGRQYSSVELRTCSCNDCGGAMIVRRHIWI